MVARLFLPGRSSWLLCACQMRYLTFWNGKWFFYCASRCSSWLAGQNAGVRVGGRGVRRAVRVILRGPSESTTQTDRQQAAPGKWSSGNWFAGPEATRPLDHWPSHLFLSRQDSTTQSSINAFLSITHSHDYSSVFQTWTQVVKSSLIFKR